MRDHPKFGRQVELEEAMRSLGIANFRKQIEEAKRTGQETEAGATRRLLGAGVAALIEAVKGFLTAAQSGKAGRRHLAVRYLRDLEPEVVALISVKGALDRLSSRPTIQRVALGIGGMVEDELHFRRFREENKREFEWTIDNVNGRSRNERVRRKTIAKMADKHGVEWSDWDTRTKLLVGLKLLEMVIETTGLVDREVETASNHSVTYIVATPETSKWIETENQRCEILFPVYMPTVIPPKPWEHPFSGGYWTGRVRKLRLLKTNNRAYLEELEGVDLSQVYAALNTIQETAWAINEPVYRVMKEMWGLKTPEVDIPSADDLPIPPTPGDLTDIPKEAMTDAQLERLKARNKDAKETHDKNVKLGGQRLQFMQLLSTAERMLEEEEFYFPHQLDFRGRIYAVPLFLNPQGNDHSKALLQFANAVPIGDEEGARWLAIHGAGLWGIDKVSMDDRVEWVIQHEREILASAEVPFHNRFWMEADDKKRWQALAFCFEWAGFRREGTAFMSSLPVQMDGTCNGLQNFSAMLRDEIGGAAVNLLPADKPSDIYQIVADRVSRRIEQDAMDGNAEAIGWQGNVTRKVTKRPVMTLPYGAQQFGFNQQIFDDTVKPWKSASSDTFPWVDSGWPAAAYMGQLVWEEVGEVVVAARKAMDWLQDAAKRAAGQGLPVRWTTPAGLVVQQVYEKQEAVRIRTTFGTGLVNVDIRQPTGELDKRKQASAIAPNFVHSLDAAHLMRTVNACREKGLRSFSLIHDSYGTHAGNAWALAQTLRKEFVRMYEGNILGAFKVELEAQTGEVLPNLPPFGNLDLAQVLESSFFFA